MPQRFSDFLEYIAEIRPLEGSYFGRCVSMRWDAWRVVRLINAKINRLVHGAPGTVLDVGCGIGIYERELRRRWPAARIVGCDFSKKNILAAKAVEPSAFFLRGDAEMLPVGDGTVDVAFAVEVMEHFLHPEKVASELARVVRPGGLLFVVAPLAPPIPCIRAASRCVTRFIGSQVIAKDGLKEHMRIYSVGSLAREFKDRWNVKSRVTFNLMTFAVAALEKIAPGPAGRITERHQRLLDALDFLCGHFLYAKGLFVFERKGKK